MIIRVAPAFLRRERKRSSCESNIKPRLKAASMEGKAPRAFQVLAYSEDVPRETMTKLFELYPSLLHQMAGTEQLARYLEDVSLEVKSLELAYRHDLVTKADALRFLREELLANPHDWRPTAALRGSRIVEDYSEAEGRLTTEVEIVGWLLRHFAFTPEEAGEIIAEIGAGPDPEIPESENFGLFAPRDKRSLSVDTIVLLAQKQPLLEETRIKLFKLLGHAACDDFLRDLLGNVEDLDTGNDAFWNRFPILRRLARISHADIEKYRRTRPPGGEWCCQRGEIAISEETASRYERLLGGMCWFARNYSAAYGPVALDRDFNVRCMVVRWLACASCYACAFDSKIHGGVRNYLGRKTYQPRVGELFSAEGASPSREVISAKKNEDGIVTEFQYAFYPRQRRDAIGDVSGLTMRLMTSGKWSEDRATAKEWRWPLVPVIRWGEVQV